MSLGGPSETKPATPEIQEIANKVRCEVEEKEHKKFPEFTAVEYTYQVVAGMIYFIKVHVGDEHYIHLCVIESLPHEKKPLTLSKYQTNKTKDDELTCF
ncbi:cystatin-B-like [Tenrec ecaudatus]|uniref:cystatin-B-like n=1 Tax=Tenrec ecaudatus TaxID=94439 RepID=UPI003F591EDC